MMLSASHKTTVSSWLLVRRPRLAEDGTDPQPMGTFATRAAAELERDRLLRIYWLQEDFQIIEVERDADYQDL